MQGWQERSTTIFRKNSDLDELLGLPNDVPNPHADLEGDGGFAAAIAGSAIFSFHLAADDLEEAARRQETVATVAQERIDALADLRDFNLAQAESNRTVAGNLRVLVGGSALEVEA